MTINNAIDCGESSLSRHHLRLSDDLRLMMWRDGVRVLGTLDDSELTFTPEPGAPPDNEDCGCTLGVGHDSARGIGAKRALACLELALCYRKLDIRAFSRFISAGSKNGHGCRLEFIGGGE